MSSSHRIIVLGTRNLTSQLFQCLPLGLRDEKSSEATTQHEQCKDLHDMVEPWIWVRLGWVAFGSKRPEHSLGNDGADLAGCS